MKILIKFQPAENAEKNNDQHLKCHAGIPGVTVKVFLWVGCHGSGFLP